ncbi:MAG: septal ring lytic transglycosylase RlpA family protein [Terriglobales bacterium]
MLVLAGCGGGNRRTRTRNQPPSPPPSSSSSSGAKISVPKNAKPLLVETGLASWYGGPYHNRRGANGEIYDMHALTAAHRTLPMNSIVRVTNLKTGNSTLVRITDRGPFVPGRVIDLSAAAAKEVNAWREGLVKVRLDVLQAPAPIDKGGRWCVQFGAFQEEDTARDLREKLARRYRGAKVIHFGSPVGDWWVRIRVPQDDRKQAYEIAKVIRPSEGSAFLVRLD